MSSSQAVHEALSITVPAHQALQQQGLTQEGLVSLLTIWQKLTAREMNRPVRTRMPGGVGGVQPQG